LWWCCASTASIDRSRPQWPGAGRPAESNAVGAVKLPRSGLTREPWYADKLLTQAPRQYGRKTDAAAKRDDDEGIGQDSQPEPDSPTVRLFGYSTRRQTHVAAKKAPGKKVGPLGFSTSQGPVGGRGAVIGGRVRFGCKSYMPSRCSCCLHATQVKHAVARPKAGRVNPTRSWQRHSLRHAIRRASRGNETTVRLFQRPRPGGPGHTPQSGHVRGLEQSLLGYRPAHWERPREYYRAY